MKTAEAMHVQPADCLVVEDSIAGLKAAKAANMICIICPDTFSHIPLTAFIGADKIVNNLNEVTSTVVQQL